MSFISLMCPLAAGRSCSTARMGLEKWNVQKSMGPARSSHPGGSAESWCWWFCDESVQTTVSSDVFLCLQLDQWPRFISARFQYTIYPITFSVGNAEEWKKLFKPCAAQRLFLPVRLQHLYSACDAINRSAEKIAQKTRFFFQTSVAINFTPMPGIYIEPEPSPGMCFCNLTQSKLPTCIDYFFPRVFIDLVKTLKHLITMIHLTIIQAVLCCMLKVSV